MTNKTITLAPTLACPFCGSKELKQVTDDGIHFTQCKYCEATGPTGFKRGEDDAVDWNTRAALADPVPPAGGAPAPEYFVAACDKFDWTPEEALRFYAEGKHFDVVDGRTRILCTGAIASHALKGIGGEYADMKGMAPAGGEPEVVGYRCRQSETEKWHMSSTPAYWEHQPVILLEEHRAHVTRLQAEVERLEEQACISGKNMLDQWNRANALQAELAKARELMVPAAHRLSDLGQSRLSEPMFAFVLNQSAPADKGQVNPEHTLFNEIRISEPVNEEGEPARYLITEAQLQRIRALEADKDHGEPVAWANWKVGTKSYVPYRTEEAASRSVAYSELAATQLGPYQVVPLYAEQPAPVAVATDFKMIGTEPMPPMEYDEP